ncbi:hypothetical protein LTR70_008527 [Exophiala xenobiotica]|uniref:Uncharacterized protein n=1 Tax=Lithohypha guttulata TaxID=1690604 RepID=A0ABR0K2T2_9EURO|nr:hypothetical protein LTR24_008121 [Lithohypha guttulata]KAK5311879.1 hypothetical protein LTR70_008527 [Exophiala xenobiotica]
MSKSSLTALPPEIRTKIYIQLFRTTPVTVHVFLQDKQPWPLCWDNEKKTCISLLLACKTINDEATQLFLDETPFEFMQYGCACLSHIAKDETAKLPQIQHLRLIDNNPRHHLDMSRFIRVMKKSLQDGRKLQDLTMDYGRWASLPYSTQSQYLEACLNFTESLHLEMDLTARDNICSGWLYAASIDQERRISLQKLFPFGSWDRESSKLEKIASHLRNIYFLQSAPEITLVNNLLSD